MTFRFWHDPAVHVAIFSAAKQPFVMCSQRHSAVYGESPQSGKQKCYAHFLFVVPLFNVLVWQVYVKK
jgi:hypothetical protein